MNFIVEVVDVMFEKMPVEAVVTSLQFPEFLNCFSLTSSNNPRKEMGSPSGLPELLF